MASSTIKVDSERATELIESLAEIRSRVAKVTLSARKNSLVAVSKYKPASDVLVCYENNQRDFGENYVQELVDKAKQLPPDIRWHFIGTLQSNKAKILASIPNLYAIQTVTSAKAAAALDKALPAERTDALNILIQVNTSGEDSKSGLAPLKLDSGADSELVVLARHIIRSCQRLHLQGLMTIGSIDQSRASGSENQDFKTLIQTRDILQDILKKEDLPQGITWGDDGRLLLSMGMSSDFEAALKAGADIVRVGTGIFGARPEKEEIRPS